MSSLSIIVPQEDTNLFSNPSVETTTSGYISLNSTISRSTTKTKWGAYSLQVMPNGLALYEGVRVVGSNLITGSTYNASLYFNGTTDDTYRVLLSGTANMSTAITFTGDDDWHRYEFDYTAPNTGVYDLIIQKTNHPLSNNVFNIDGLMLKLGAGLSTYVDGDQPGSYWNAGEHNSTSTRSAEQRDGGLIVDLDTYSLYAEQYLGIGMPQVTNIAQEYGFQNGASYQRTRVPPRTINIPSHFLSTDKPNLYVLRSAFEDVIKPDLVIEDMPLRLRWTGNGKTRDIYAVYESGLEFGETTGYMEKIPLRFTAYDPFWYDDGEESAQLDPQNSGSSPYAMLRESTGVWNYFGSNFNGAVYGVTYDKKNNVYYFAGDFTAVNGVAASGIAKYSVATDTFSGTIAGSTNGAVFAIAIAPNGDIYAGGVFTTIGGVSANRVARYNGSVWSALGTGTINGVINTLAFSNDGILYAGGTFTSMGGVANTSKIAKWNGSAWSALGTGVNSTVYKIVKSPDGYMYVGGIFTTANSVTVNGICYWNGTTFVPLNGGVSAIVTSMAFTTDGSLYVGGSFTAADSIPANRVAKWNGSYWSPLASGVSNDVWSVATDSDNNVYVGGIFTAASNYTLPSNLAKWNGSSWLPVDAGFSVTPNGVSDINITKAGRLITTFYSSAGTVTNGANTTITNSGKANAYPRFIIDGPASGTATLYQITNYTTKDSIYLSSALTISAGERLILDLRPGQKSFTSDFQGDVYGKIMPGSNTGNFKLKSGTNNISVFSSSSTITVNMIWQKRYWGADQ